MLNKCGKQIRDLSIYLLLKNLNCRYTEGIQNCDIYKNAYHTEVKDNIIIITLKKNSSQTWHEFFLSIQNEKKELTMECKIAVTIIRNLYEGYNLDEMTIKLLEQRQYESSTAISYLSGNIKEAVLYKYKNGENYLSHTVKNYVLCSYNNLHPGVWLYLDEDLDTNNKKVCYSEDTVENTKIIEPMYVGLSFKGIKRKPMKYWQEFISNELLNSFEDLNTSNNPSHLGKFHKEGKIYIYTIPNSPYVKYDIYEDNITVYINDKFIKLKLIGIANNIKKHIDENPPTISLQIEDETEDHSFCLHVMNFEVEIGKIYSAFTFGISFNFPSLDEVYKLYPVLETM